MKKFIATTAAAGVLLVVAASGASAGGPTCQSEGGWANHGEHITEDYVVNDLVSGGAPAHFGSGHQPGASFCLDGQAQSKPIDPKGRRS